jgi:hypothetical protein
MKKNQNAKKAISRDKKLEIRMSEEEKNLWYKYAEELGINPSRLARNILMMEAESLINKYYTNHLIKAYIKYAKLTNNKEILERINKED